MNKSSSAAAATVSAAAATVSAAAVAFSVGVSVLAANGGDSGSGRAVQSILNENFIDFDAPTEALIEVPTEIPTNVPIEVPTEVPINVPIKVPTEAPTKVPIEVPIEAPTEFPIEVPIEVPTEMLIEVPIEAPTEFPIEVPIGTPAEALIEVPIEALTEFPIEVPTEVPIEAPTTIKIPANDIRFAASIRAAEIVRLSKIRAAANRMSDFDGEDITVEVEVHAPPDNEDVIADDCVVCTANTFCTKYWQYHHALVQI